MRTFCMVRKPILLLLILAGCSVTSAIEPVNTAAIDVAIAEAIVEERKPPELPNDFPPKATQPADSGTIGNDREQSGTPKTNSSETPKSSKPLVAEAVQPSGGHSSPSHDTAQPLFELDLPTLCITIGGIDYDLDKLMDQYVNPRTWPGTDEQSLRNHLHSERHKVGGIDDLSFEDLKKLHAAIHERESQTVTKAVPSVAPKPTPKVIQAAPAPVYRVGPNCPSGSCPQPQYRQWSQPRYGLFRRRRR